MKLIGMLLIILCGSAIGVFRSQKLQRRQGALEELLLLMRLFAGELQYSLASTDQILEHLCENNRFKWLGFLYRCNELCQQNIPFPTAWEKSAEKAEFLSAEDKKLIVSLSAQLGCTDLEGQIGVIHLYENLLQDRLSQAREQCRTYSKLYTTLGFLGGVLVSIVLL